MAAMLDRSATMLAQPKVPPVAQPVAKPLPQVDETEAPETATPPVLTPVPVLPRPTGVKAPPCRGIAPADPELAEVVEAPLRQASVRKPVDPRTETTVDDDDRPAPETGCDLPVPTTPAEAAFAAAQMPVVLIQTALAATPQPVAVAPQGGLARPVTKATPATVVKPEAAVVAEVVAPPTPMPEPQAISPEAADQVVETAAVTASISPAAKPLAAEPGKPVAAKAEPEKLASIEDRSKPSSHVAPVETGHLPPALHVAATTVPDATPALAVTRHLDLARDDAWLDDLARDIAATASSGGRLKFALMPENMGRLDVEVRREDAGVHVHLAARNEAARDALAAAQPRIADEIRAQGIRLAGTEVSSGFGGDRAASTHRPEPLIEAALAAPAPEEPDLSHEPADGRYA